jgi:hypothetical protein
MARSRPKKPQKSAIPQNRIDQANELPDHGQNSDPDPRSPKFSSPSRAQRDVGNALAYRLGRLAHEVRQSAAGPRTAAGLNALVPVEVMDVVETDYFGKAPPKRGGKKTVTRVGLLLAEHISLAEQIKADMVPKERQLQ